MFALNMKYQIRRLWDKQATQGCVVIQYPVFHNCYCSGQFAFDSSALSLPACEVFLTLIQIKHSVFHNKQISHKKAQLQAAILSSHTNDMSWPLKKPCNQELDSYHKP